MSLHKKKEQTGNEEESLPSTLSRVPSRPPDFLGTETEESGEKMVPQRGKKSQVGPKNRGQSWKCQEHGESTASTHCPSQNIFQGK